MVDKKMEDCHFFRIGFKAIMGDVKGELFSTCEDNIMIDFANGFNEFELCSTEYIDNSDVFLGNKKRFIDLKKGDAIAICEVPVIIVDIDFETCTDFNEACERIEMEDLRFFSGE